MASLEKLQNEILLKEEAFLKEEKAKLTEQLNKLKVFIFINFPDLSMIRLSENVAVLIFPI